MSEEVTGVIRILVVDESPIVAHGVDALCRAESDLSVTRCVRRGHEAMLALEEGAYEVVLIDMCLPDQLGLDAVRTMHQRWPHQAILVFSGQEERLYAVRALRAGARGFLRKQAEGADLISAIRVVASGEHYLTPAMSELLARQVSGVEVDDLSARLSDREFEVFRQLALGKAVQHIASDLALSRQTVTTYRRRVLDKLELGDNAAIMACAARHGIASGGLDSAAL